MNLDISLNLNESNELHTFKLTCTDLMCTHNIDSILVLLWLGDGIVSIDDIGCRTRKMAKSVFFSGSQILSLSLSTCSLFVVFARIDSAKFNTKTDASIMIALVLLCGFFMCFPLCRLLNHSIESYLMKTIFLHFNEHPTK